MERGEGGRIQRCVSVALGLIRYVCFCTGVIL